MRPRRPRLTRRERQESLARAVQLIRLEEIARGQREPEWPREEFYRQLLEDGHHPDPEGFILPAALTILERRGMMGELYVEEKPSPEGRSRSEAESGEGRA